MLKDNPVLFYSLRNMIKELRQSVNWNQSELAFRLGVSEKLVIAWENKEALLNANDATRLYQLLYDHSKLRSENIKFNQIAAKFISEYNKFYPKKETVIEDTKDKDMNLFPLALTALVCPLIVPFVLQNKLS